MDFEWDDDKSAWTRRTRGFGFETAVRIFEEPTLDMLDERHDYGEDRVVALGAIGEEVLVVVYADRNGVRRIISARRASRQERLIWQSFANH